ncbi:MAG: carbon-nitrogen family hydrolase [Ardenticatenaceae bacterium]
MNQLTLSLAQMPIVVGDPESNLAKARQMAAEAAQRGSDLLLLPELWGSGYDLSNATQHATLQTEGLFAEMGAMAEAHGMWVGGSLLGYDRNVKGRPRNQFALFAPNGKLACSYAKLHLFRLMDEDQWLDPGDNPTFAKLPWGTAGIAICYDLRFPELFRDYALAGTRLILLPAEWPHPRLMHWRTLLRARAIENQCFIAACNRVGEDPNGTRFFGHSAILDPWGEPLIEGNEEEALLTATIDLAEVTAVRKKIPIFDDIRNDLYFRGVTYTQNTTSYWENVTV